MVPGARRGPFSIAQEDALWMTAFPAFRGCIVQVMETHNRLETVRQVCEGFYDLFTIWFVECPLYIYPLIRQLVMLAGRLYRNEMVAAVIYTGYYCPGAQNTDQPIAYQCSVGHYCPAGSLEEIRCESGTYQDETTQGSCKVSPQNLLHMSWNLENLVELGCLILNES